MSQLTMKQCLNSSIKAGNLGRALASALLAPVLAISGLTMGSAVHANIQQNNNSFQFVGRAYDPNSEELLYTETHKIQLDEKGEYETAEVLYKDKDGNVFARKQLSYGDDITLPETHFYELDSPFFYKVKNKASKLSVEYQDEQENTYENVAIEDKGFHVVDAGFDRLVSQNWQTLLDGDALTFAFLAVTRSQFFDFRLVKETDKKMQKDGQLVLRLEPSNAILRWILDPAYLSYDLDNKKLLRFTGLTNVRKRPEGQVLDENYIAVIKYDYL